MVTIVIKSPKCYAKKIIVIFSLSTFLRKIILPVEWKEVILQSTGDDRSVKSQLR